VGDSVTLVFDVETLRVVDVGDGGSTFGYSRDELLASDAFALFPRWWNAAKTMQPGASVVTFLKPKRGPGVPVEVRFDREVRAARAVLVAAVHVRPPLSEVEHELESTNAYLHAIVENIPDMIFVKDAKSHAFKRFNRAGEELLGFTRGELLGKTDHDFYPKEQADFFHQKDDETMAAGRIVDIPAEPISTKLKGLRVLHTRKIPVYDADGAPQYLLGISEDITERLAAEQRVRELASVVENARDAVVTLSVEGSVASWNPAAERLYGVSAADAVGKPFTRFVPEPELEAFHERVRGVLRGDDVEVREVSRLRADGRDIDVEETLFPVVDVEGSVQRVACIARDLTELGRWRRATQVLSATREPKLQVGEPSSAAMREAIRNADLVAADANATVLILGETGVGKSWLARRVHQRSPRADKPFFEVNCAGLGQQLVESELFGHERGAFTGAVSQKRGLVETAEGGALFLDEVGELSLGVQAQLLTFIDTRTFRRVGGTRALTANVRLIAATNIDLRLAVEQGKFRRDLFYRLSVVPLTIPPLRDRRDEIASLAREMLAELGRRSGKSTGPLRAEIVDALSRYDWPGNLRELRNALERALILSRGERIELEHLPVEVRERPTHAAPSHSLDALEREHILKVLRDANGNRTRAAAMLGISRSTLNRKLADLGQ
jgi:two-component system response regulator HydG